MGGRIRDLYVELEPQPGEQFDTAIDSLFIIQFAAARGYLHQSRFNTLLRAIWPEECLGFDHIGHCQDFSLGDDLFSLQTFGVA